LCLTLLYIDNTNMERARSFYTTFEFVTSPTIIPVPQNYVPVTLTLTAVVWEPWLQANGYGCSSCVRRPPIWISVPCAEGRTGAALRWVAQQAPQTHLNFHSDLVLFCVVSCLKFEFHIIVKNSCIYSSCRRYKQKTETLPSSPRCSTTFPK
jgi:hypothetical protein